MTRLSLLCAIGAFFVATAMPAETSADVPVPVALASLQPGQWQLRSLEGGGAVKTLCLGDPRVLLQLRHGTTPCNRIIITNTATQAIVHYSCAGAGNGRTSVRVETPRVIQVESQGIADKAPFDVAYEGRRIGNCPAAGPTAQR
jgi:hypothetical protein